jgi:hypothetical protein
LFYELVEISGFNVFQFRNPEGLPVGKGRDDIIIEKAAK